MILGLASAKHAPGVTTTALALALAKSGDGPVTLVEADPAGGDLAARLGLQSSRGLVGLAAAARRECSAELVDAHLQPVDSSVSVLVAPPWASRAAAALDVVASPLATALVEEGAEAVCDLGRLDQHSPALPLARQADLLVLVARPTVAELAHVVTRAPELAELGPPLGLVLVGSAAAWQRSRYPAEAVAEELREVVDVLGAVAFDRGGAQLLERGELGRRAARSALVSSARALAESIGAWSGDRAPTARPATLADGLVSPRVVTEPSS